MGRHKKQQVIDRPATETKLKTLEESLELIDRINPFYNNLSTNKRNYKITSVISYPDESGYGFWIQVTFGPLQIHYLITQQTQKYVGRYFYVTTETGKEIQFDEIDLLYDIKRDMSVVINLVKSLVYDA